MAKKYVVRPSACYAGVLTLYLQTTELEGVFRDKYGFTTHRVILDCTKKPEAQLLFATSKFIMDHDGPHRTTLLIVYYNGHGFVQEEDGLERFYATGCVSARQ